MRRDPVGHLLAVHLDECTPHAITALESNSKMQQNTGTPGASGMYVATQRLQLKYNLAPECLGESCLD